MHSRTLLPSVLTLLALIASQSADGASIRGSRHDLSTAGGGDSDQICAFCHTPHSSNRVLDAPLWNRFIDRSKVFTPYQSATLNGIPGNPNDSLASILCLGCHDGTLGTAVVNTYVGSDKHDLVNAPGPGGIPDTTSWPNCERCHPDFYGGQRPKWQGTDLSNDHPIAISYPTTALDPGFLTPPDPVNGWPSLPLFSGKVECASCHDVHDPALTPFLRSSNVGSQLCLTCHIK